jgi:hypothetical protein
MGNVFNVVAQLKNAVQADYVMLGGGNARRLRVLPADTFLGDNENARLGGLRLWHSQRKRPEAHRVSPERKIRMQEASPAD